MDSETSVIIDAYGYASAGGVLRRRRAEELFTSRRAARCHATCGEPPDSLPRGAARAAAARPVGPPRGADRGGARALPRRAAPARARGADRRAGRGRRGGRAPRAARDRRFVRPGRLRPSAPPVRVRASPPRRDDRAVGLRHADRRRPGRAPRARARDRRRGAPPAVGRVRAVLPRRGRARVPAGPSAGGHHRHHRRAARRGFDRHAGGRRRPRGDRGRAAAGRDSPEGPRAAARARPAGVGAERRSRRLRRDLHLALGDRGRPRRGLSRRRACRGARARSRDLARARGWPLAHAQRGSVRLVRARAARVIVGWGLGRLPAVLAEAGVARPTLVASRRWAGRAPAEPHATWSEVPSERIEDAAAAAVGSDGILAVGGGSAIDLGKAISAATGLPLVSVPTTYSGAEWTGFFGIRDPSRRMRGGGSARRSEPTTRPRVPRSWRASRASSGSATSASPRTSSGRWRRRPPSGPARRRTRAPPGRPRSRSSTARSGEALAV